MIEDKILSEHPSVAADVLEEHSEDVIAAYERRLLAIGSPLLDEPKTREQVMAQARSVLREVVAVLRGEEVPSQMQQSATRLSKNIGVSRASGNVHAFHSLRAVIAFSEAALSVVVDNLPSSPTSPKEVAAVAVAIQNSFMERVWKAAVAYANYLLEKAHESHADERRRISRELHDRVAHSIMVSFRSLELYELYRTKDPSKGQAKLERAKSMTQEALELTRSLSRELRSTSAEEGLEAALSELLSVTVPQEMRSWASVKGDESLLTPQARDELFLILREGVRNAVKHSGAKTIKVEVDVTERYVRAVVEDDGQGFELEEEAARSDGTGLTSMNERASLLGGTLNLASEPGKGTKIEILLPLLSESRR